MAVPLPDTLSCSKIWMSSDRADGQPGTLDQINLLSENSLEGLATDESVVQNYGSAPSGDWILTQIVGIMVNRRHLTGDFFDRHKQGDLTSR